eukprot:10180269-Prorocentrum_lima.AAC.1
MSSIVASSSPRPPRRPGPKAERKPASILGCVSRSVARYPVDALFSFEYVHARMLHPKGCGEAISITPVPS